ncbi:MAG: dTMP kinase [Chloroflexi bacterium]|nr:dTMP kinase [Chloroflexota bacterium]
MGLFVVFERVEGSGKSTQSRALQRRLTRSGYPSTLVREPGSTPTGERISRWLKSDHDITPLAELLLFSAARASLVESLIRPALRDSEIVVCDRYIYSTLAYQGHGRGLDMDVIRQLNEITTGGLLPHLVVLLDLPPEDGLARKAGRPLDRIEREQADFHQRVRQGYLNLAQHEPERWLVLNSAESRASLSESIWNRVSQMLKKGERLASK